MHTKILQPFIKKSSLIITTTKPTTIEQTIIKRNIQTDIHEDKGEENDTKEC